MLQKSHYIRLYTNFASAEGMNCLIELLNEHAIKVLDMQISKVYDDEQKEIVAILQIKTKRHISHSDNIRMVSGIEGLKLIEEI